MFHSRMLRVLKCFMTSIHGQSSDELIFSFIKTLPQSLWYITASGTNVLFYWQMTGQFLKYILPFFIILLQEIIFNQYLIKQAKGEEKKLLRVCTTSRQSCCTFGSFALSTWKGCCDMRKVCGNIFEGCNVRQKINVKHISSRNLRLYDDIYIGICQIF